MKNKNKNNDPGQQSKKRRITGMEEKRREGKGAISALREGEARHSACERLRERGAEVVIAATRWEKKGKAL